MRGRPMMSSLASIGETRSSSTGMPMWFLWVSVLVVGMLWATGGLWAQAIPIVTIDYYGLRTISEQAVSQKLGIAVGDTLEWSNAWRRFQPVIERLEEMSGVAEARVEAFCCREKKFMLFVGIREESAAPIEYRPPPDSSIALSQEIIETHQNWGKALEAAAQKGGASLDHSQGHMLSSDPEVRAFEEQFIVYAEKHREKLRQVLRHAADAEQRQMATWVIGYASDKRVIVDDMLYAARDSAPWVRNNAIRILGVIAEYAQDRPELGIQIPAAPFIPMLNSVDWTDRNKAAFLLRILTESRDPTILQQIREQALPSLVEMARWKSEGHASSPFELLGRVAGLSKQEMRGAMGTGEKDRLIDRMVEAIQSEK